MFADSWVTRRERCQRFYDAVAEFNIIECTRGGFRVFLYIDCRCAERLEIVYTLKSLLGAAVTLRDLDGALAFRGCAVATCFPNSYHPKVGNNLYDFEKVRSPWQEAETG